MKKVILFTLITAILFGQDIVPLNKGNKWIYHGQNFTEDHRTSEILSQFTYTTIKEVTSDTLIDDQVCKVILVTTIYDSSITYYKDWALSDSTKFYYDSKSTDDIFYDAYITEDSTFSGDEYYKYILVYQDSLWGHLYDFQKWGGSGSSLMMDVQTWHSRTTAKYFGNTSYYLGFYDESTYEYNEKEWNIIGATIDGIYYGTASPPINLVAISDTHSVQISWDAVSESNVVKYNLYYGLHQDTLAFIKSTSDADDPICEIDGLHSGTQYFLRVTAINDDGEESPFSSYLKFKTLGDPTGLKTLHNLKTGMDICCRLMQNYPNPFNPTTKIPFSLPKSGKLSLKIYDLYGQRIITLYEGYQHDGIYELAWSGLNEKGNQVSSGLYFYVLNFEGTTIKNKMLLVR